MLMNCERYFCIRGGRARSHVSDWEHVFLETNLERSDCDEPAQSMHFVQLSHLQVHDERTLCNQRNEGEINP
jgi:hypothetical protein